MKKEERKNVLGIEVEDVEIGNFVCPEEEYNGDKNEAKVVWEVKAISSVPSFLESDRIFEEKCEKFDYDIAKDSTWYCLQNLVNGSKFRWILEIELKDGYVYLGNTLNVNV